MTQNKEDLLKNKKFTCRVSSTLNRNASMFGKKYLFDSDQTTCWNSDQGLPQWIEIQFDENIAFSSFAIQFQGGFVGTECLVETSGSEDGNKESEPFYPEDDNSVQVFRLSKQKTCKCVKFLFQGSSDTYGRIVIYKLSIFE